jgi:hypothetical protein
VRVRHRLTRGEFSARVQIKVPPGHPEWVTRDLDAASEEDLAWLCDEAWPLDEWVDAVDEDRRRRES